MIAAAADARPAREVANGFDLYYTIIPHVRMLFALAYAAVENPEGECEEHREGRMRDLAAFATQAAGAVIDAHRDGCIPSEIDREICGLSATLAAIGAMAVLALNWHSSLYPKDFLLPAERYPAELLWLATALWDQWKDTEIAGRWESLTRKANREREEA